MRIKNILVGWGTWLGALPISQNQRRESERRLKICDTCAFATPSKALEFINGNANDVDTKYCNKCLCPCHQKSIVPEESCPEKFW